MGRKTYEVALRSGYGGGYPGVKNYVFSRTLPEDPGGGVTLVRGEAAEFVRGLKGQDGKDICLMGGGELARSLFEAGLIDEWPTWASDRSAQRSMLGRAMMIA